VQKTRTRREKVGNFGISYIYYYVVEISILISMGSAGNTGREEWRRLQIAVASVLKFTLLPNMGHSKNDQQR
jgi:hypothetical protein